MVIQNLTSLEWLSLNLNQLTVSTAGFRTILAALPRCVISVDGQDDRLEGPPLPPSPPTAPMPVPSGRDARWRAGLAVGDVLDAQDSDKKWFDSKIVEVDAPTDRV